MGGTGSRRRRWPALAWIMLAPLGCRGADLPAAKGSEDSSAASTNEVTSTSASATSDDPVDGDSESDGSGEEGPKLDIGEKLDFEPEPPDPFEPAPLGCEGVRFEGPLLAIDLAGAWIDEVGLIRVRLLDGDPELYYWDISVDLEPAAMLPASYVLEFSGYLTEPAIWEWWHGSINGELEIELHVAELGGCLVAEIQASTNDWHSEAPPLGWLVTPLQPWPE